MDYRSRIATSTFGASRPSGIRPPSTALSRKSSFNSDSVGPKGYGTTNKGATARPAWNDPSRDGSATRLRTSVFSNRPSMSANKNMFSAMSARKSKGGILFNSMTPQTNRKGR